MACKMQMIGINDDEHARDMSTLVHSLYVYKCLHITHHSVVPLHTYEINVYILNYVTLIKYLICKNIFKRIN